jgi:DNA-binding IclR family transcriptional regulator
MMPAVEVVWRHLLVGARAGRRRWSSITELACELELALSTTHRSLAHPMEIGVVEVGPVDGLQVLDPARLLMLLAAHRHIQRDVLRRSWVAVPVAEVEAAASSRSVVLGGFGAAIAHFGGEPDRRLHPGALLR